MVHVFDMMVALATAASTFTVVVSMPVANPVAAPAAEAYPVAGRGRGGRPRGIKVAHVTVKSNPRPVIETTDDKKHEKDLKKQEKKDKKHDKKKDDKQHIQIGLPMREDRPLPVQPIAKPVEKEPVTTNDEEDGNTNVDEAFSVKPVNNQDETDTNVADEADTVDEKITVTSDEANTETVDEGDDSTTNV